MFFIEPSHVVPRPPRAIATPCVKVCVVDGASSHCLGCYRTLAEIAAWTTYTDADRARIMAELPDREARLVGGR